MTSETHGPTTPSAEFWEPLFAGSEAPTQLRPNVVFQQAISDLSIEPARAWDMACGHGGDALWLASQGWTVTATDVSSTAVSRVTVSARTAGLGDSVEDGRHDLTRTQPSGPFDLVYANYFHSPVEFDRDAVLREAAGRTRPGGHFVVIDHASSAPWSREQRDPASFPTPADTLASIGLPDAWSVVRCERSERTATGPDGTTTATVADSVIILRHN